jgi:hypothetical protein
VLGNAPGEQPREVLALAASSFQTECGTVAIRTLKRRKHSMREVPLPPELMTTSSNAPPVWANRITPRRDATNIRWRRARSFACGGGSPGCVSARSAPDSASKYLVLRGRRNGVEVVEFFVS